MVRKSVPLEPERGSPTVIPRACTGARIICKRGQDVLSDPLLNKGTCYTDDERERLGLRGLLPPRVSSTEQQVSKVYEHFRTGVANILPGDNTVTREMIRRRVF